LNTPHTYVRKDLEGDAGILNETTHTSLGDVSTTSQTAFLVMGAGGGGDLKIALL